MRYLIAEQFLGVMFSSLLEKGIFEIKLEDFNSLEKQVDHVLREKNGAVLTISSEEIIVTLEEYSDFIDMKDHSISLQQDLSDDFSNRKEEVIAKIEEYFTLGIPNDIRATLERTIEQYPVKRESYD